VSARLLATLACVALAGCARATPAPVPDGALVAPVFVVRHAEKAAQPGDDPPLSEAGVVRSAALGLRLEGTRLGGVVVTNRLRTLQTAIPALRSQRIDTTGAAGRLVRVPLGTDGAAGHARRVADSVRALARRTRGAVLVVGHSNTVGPIVNALGGPDYGELCDTEYAWLFVLTPTRGAVEPTRLTYGAPDPPADPACGRRMRP
jgi:broad specificity phosphatase PhoE